MLKLWRKENNLEENSNVNTYDLISEYFKPVDKKSGENSNEAGHLKESKSVGRPTLLR